MVSEPCLDQGKHRCSGVVSESAEFKIDHCRSAMPLTSTESCLWFGSRQSAILGRRPTEWSVGGSDLQIFVRKVLSSAGIPLAVWVASLLAITPTCSPTETDPPQPHPSPVVKRFYVPTSTSRHRMARIHPKMGNTVGLSRTS